MSSTRAQWVTRMRAQILTGEPLYESYKDSVCEQTQEVSVSGAWLSA